MISDQDLLFLNKHHIKYTCALNVTYTIDDNIEKHDQRFKRTECIHLPISYQNCIYNIRLFKTHLLIINASNDLELVYYVLNYCHLKFSNVKIEHITCKFDTKNSIVPENICLSYRKTKTAVILKFGAISPSTTGSIHVYNNNHCVIGDNLKNIKEMYTYLYAHVDLPSILKLLFNHKSSMFYTLPLELCDVILSFI